MDEPKIINVHGIPVELWSRKTLADGNAMSHNTIEPICSAILSGDEYLQYQLDLYKGATDVINVFSNYRDFSSNSAKYFNPEYSATWYLTNNDIVKIIRDENSHSDVASGHQTYYKWINNPSVTGDPHSPSDGSWNYIGYADPYYNIEEIDEKLRDISVTISANYLSAKGDIASGKNIVIYENSDSPRITVATKDDVEFNTVSSYRLSGKYIVVPGTGNIGTCDIYNLNVKKIADYTSGQISADFSALLYSAYSGAAASAWINENNKDLAHVSSFDYVNNSNVITGYGGSAFAGGISSISLISNGSTSSTVITGKNRNIVFYSDNPDNLRIFSATTPEAGHEIEYIHFSASEGKIYTGDYSINVDNVNDKISLNSAISSIFISLPYSNGIYNGQIDINGQYVQLRVKPPFSDNISATWSELLHFMTQNFVKAKGSQNITLATATNDLTPETMENDIIYMV